MRYMAKKKRKRKEEDKDLHEPILYDDPFEEEDEETEFWEGLEGDIVAAQKKAVELFATPRGMAKFTLTDFGSGGEAKTIAMLKSIAEIVPDPVLRKFVDNYVVMKRAIHRRGVKDIIAVVGGRAWRILQNINLSRIRKVQETKETEEW